MLTANKGLLSMLLPEPETPPELDATAEALGYFTVLVSFSDFYFRSALGWHLSCFYYVYEIFL